MVSKNLVDIKENDIIKYDKELLPILLRDNSSKQNIIWATDNYEPLGEGYEFNSPIDISLITGSKGDTIRPRVNKTKTEQQCRVKDKAEVFTPSWICNKQNNLVDNAWFDTENIFNIETTNGWKTQPKAITFPTITGRTWQDYVKDVRLEVACGEAPYLVSRYDTITGDPISVVDRIGLLDRKLRVVSENTTSLNEWNEWAKVAVQCIYGFEWQGDNLLLARESILFTYIDYHKDKFDVAPQISELLKIAKIISWNVWQMDGLKGVIPNSCGSKKETTCNLFDEEEIRVKQCDGCSKNDIRKHNGIYCKIKDWQTGGTIKFISLIKQ